MARFTLGGQVPLKFSVTDATGAAVNTTTQTITVNLPDGTTTQLTGGSVTNPSTGTYLAFYTPTLIGRHVWSAATTGPATTTPPDTFHVGDTTDAPIVGLADIRDKLGVSVVTTDAQLLRYAMEASDRCEKWTGRKWRRYVVTENHSGGVEKLRLRALPAQSITTVVENGITLGTAQYFLDDVASLACRGTKLAPLWWMPGVDNITITYVAGPTGGVVPDDIQGGVLELIRHYWNTQRGGAGLPRQQGGDSEWDPRSGYDLPHAVTEKWQDYQAAGF